MRKCLTAILLFLVMMGLGTAVLAQQRQFFGTVVNSKDEPVKYASIHLVGTKGGVSADDQGRFTITARAGQQLVVSAVGMEPQTITLGGNSSVVIKLAPSGANMGEVVVTALGISRAKKTLGYAVQELKNASLTEAADNNIVNTISGKIAGAQVTSGGSTVGASSRIVIRGNAGFLNNQPLFVVDGTPIDNTTSNLNGGGGIDWGNAA